MVTIHRERGFDVVIFTNDHAPAHVHVYRGGGEAKINLLGPDGLPELIYVDGLKRSDVRRAMDMVEQNVVEFMERWLHIHG